MRAKMKCLVLFCSFLMLASNQAIAQQDKLPDAKQVLADYFKAIGGEEKVSQLKSMQMEFTIDFPGVGL
ncbi:MAG: hypothetical protein ACK49R_17525, partial [Planctomycetota bacterium]